MFGQTEINYIVGNCGSYVDAQGGAAPGLAGAARAAWAGPTRATAWR
jgi:hypothetical protein